MSEIQSIQIGMFMNEILFNSDKKPIPLENVTDEMKKSDRYDYYSCEGAYHSEPFCRICDMLGFKINFHRLNDYFDREVGGKEVNELVIFGSEYDPRVFCLFDMWNERTDQMGYATFAVYCTDEQFPTVYGEFQALGEQADYFIPTVTAPSDYVHSVLKAENGVCALGSNGEPYRIKQGINL